MASTTLSVLPEISLSSLNEQITARSRRRGYHFFVQGYLHSILFDLPSKDEVVAKAKCYRSMRKHATPHRLLINIECSTRKITYSKCSCTAGLSGKCSHIVGLLQALIHYQQWGMKEVPADMSCTQLQQLWGRPRGAKIKPERVQKIVLTKLKEGGRRRRGPVKCVQRKDRVIPIPDNTVENLAKYQSTPLSFLLTPGLEMEETALGPVQAGSPFPDQLHKSEEECVGPVETQCGNTVFPCMEAAAVSLPDGCAECSTAMPITSEEAKELEKKPIRKAASEVWHEARECRITASNFHRVIKRKKDFNEQFVRSIMSPSRFSSIPTCYGTAHEPIAKEEYCQKKPWVHVHDCGIVVHPAFSFLGASPDGKICCEGVTGILEIKCPYSARDKTILQAVQEINDFCLAELDGVIRLRKDHNYMYQIQGQLMITGAPFCEFVVYTKVDMHIKHIVPDLHFHENMIKKLACFYKLHSLPYMCTKKTPSS